jgi:ABC-2 type transport system ATP-binding protein
VLVNSHILSELETICDQLAVVVKGRVALEGTLHELTASRRRWVLSWRGADIEWPDHEVERDGELRRLTLPGASAEDAQPAIDRIRSAGGVIVSVTEVRESLEDLFMRALQLAGDEHGHAPGAVQGKQA